MDRFIPAAENFVSAVFGPDVFESNDDLKGVVEQVLRDDPNRS